jgi:hypothetical protein
VRRHYDKAKDYYHLIFGPDKVVNFTAIEMKGSEYWNSSKFFKTK